MRESPFSIETQSTTVLDAHGTRVSVRSRAVRLARLWLGHYGNGFIWNRPLDVTIEPAGSEPQRIVIWDVTRIAVVAILGIGVLGSWVIRMGMRRA